MEEVVSTNWLHENLIDENLIILDASINSTANGKTSDLSTITIPNSRHFNLKNNFSDQENPIPNTLPSESQFESECRRLGINKTSKIVVFDNLGIYSSPRVWWMFKAMGHNEVYVLNGGLPEWIKSGFETSEKQIEKYNSGDFKASFQKKYFKSYHDILENVTTKSYTIIDARSEGRFKGIEKEPRKHLKSGHIPNSINIPFNKVLENGKFRTQIELKRIFEEKCSITNDLVFSCGSGLTACIVMMASEISYKKSKRIYDGSWTEWAELQNLKENVV